MAWGLPKLPGLTFSDPTKSQFHIKSSLRYYQGYRFPDSVVRGPGGTPTDVDSNAFALPEDSVNYDPSLTYGRVKQAALPAVIPHWVHYDKRCLNFTAFFKQPVYDNPDESYRVRVVNLVYFLEDDTLTVMEPRVREERMWQKYNIAISTNTVGTAMVTLLTPQPYLEPLSESQLKSQYFSSARAAR